jgi:hypothetical protein
MPIERRHSGHPVTSKKDVLDQVCTLVKNDKRLIICEMAED